MDGLTYWCDNGHGGGKWFVAIDAEGGEDYGPHVDRLAAYEETGLEPGEIEQLKGEVFRLRLDKQELSALGPIDRLRELKQADDEGRCVVLPAKPDQTIYQWRIGDDCPSVSRLDGVQINADGEITYPIWCGHLTPGDFGKTVFLTREEAERALNGGGQGGTVRSAENR